MPILSVPERYQAGVSKIRELDLAIVQSLREALNSASNPSHQGETATSATGTAAGAVRASFPAGQASDFRQIAEALTSMYLARSSQEIPIDEFVDGIADSMEALGDPELRLLPSERATFTEKLRILLGADAFRIVTKVDELQTEAERVFCRARILTDLRPVFGAEIGQGPLAVLITHNLKIAFHQSGRTGDHDFFVTLDTEDLAQLRRLIDRAQAKAEALRRLVPEGVPIFGADKQ